MHPDNDNKMLKKSLAKCGGHAWNQHRAGGCVDPNADAGYFQTGSNALDTVNAR